MFVSNNFINNLNMFVTFLNRFISNNFTIFINIFVNIFISIFVNICNCD